MMLYIEYMVLIKLRDVIKPPFSVILFIPRLVEKGEGSDNSGLKFMSINELILVLYITNNRKHERLFTLQVNLCCYIYIVDQFIELHKRSVFTYVF